MIMKRTTAFIGGFVWGVFVGSLFTYFSVKDRFADISQKEIDEIKAFYKEKEDSSAPEEKKETEKENALKKDKKDYVEFVKKTGYTNYSDISSESNDIQVIKPDEYGENPDFDTVSLVHYADGVLTDDRGEIIPIDEYIDMVGNYAEHFGEYEEDSVYIRNNKRQTDYEILADIKTYEERNEEASDYISKRS